MLVPMTNACKLPAVGLDERLRWIRAEIGPRVVGTEIRPDGIVWELEDAPGLDARLDHLAALEADCCSGVVFEHAPSSAPGRRRLEVRGLDPRGDLLERLGVERPGSRRVGPRLARAAGFGMAVGLLVCCALPFVAAPFVGAAAVAHLARLDDPWAIAGSAGLFGALAFAWQGRRRSNRHSLPTGGCP
jgi:hypothetical protein